MDLAKLLPILTGSIAVLSAAVGVAIYVTKLRCEISQSHLENVTAVRSGIARGDNKWGKSCVGLEHSRLLLF